LGGGREGGIEKGGPGGSGSIGSAKKGTCVSEGDLKNRDGKKTGRRRYHSWKVKEGRRKKTELELNEGGGHMELGNAGRSN